MPAHFLKQDLSKAKLLWERCRGARLCVTISVHYSHCFLHGKPTRRLWPWPQTQLHSLSAFSCNAWFTSPKCNLLNAIVRRARFILCGFQVRRHDDQDAVLASEHSKCQMCRYAIAMAMRDNQKVVYTSPLKALSNQKFRELEEEFKDVGLMTGDVSINPNAPILVMTTEILRSMLYR